MGKPQSGLLEGAMTMFGNYDQCLKIRVYDYDDDDDDDGGGGGGGEVETDDVRRNDNENQLRFENFYDADGTETIENNNEMNDLYYDTTINDRRNVEFFRGQYCIVEFKPWLPSKPRFYGMNSRYEIFKKSLYKSDKEDENNDFNDDYDYDRDGQETNRNERNDETVG